MTAPTPMVHYHVGLFGKEGLGENCAIGRIQTDSLTDVETQDARVISATPIGPILKLDTSFVS